MTDLKQAAQQALEALEALKWKGSPSFVKDAITSLRAAFAEPEQEPVCWQWLDTANFRKKRPTDAIPEHWRPLYTAPTPRRPLTNEEISAILDDTLEGGSFFDVALAAARAIERAHGIGEQT